MKKRLPILLASLIGSALYIKQAMADDLPDQCLFGVPLYNKTLINGAFNMLPVYIQADKVATNYPDNILFSGNVDIKQGNSRLTANKVQFTQHQEKNQMPLRTVIATGNINYISKEIKLKGSEAWSNLNTKDTDVYQGNYQMIGRQGRGEADSIKQRGDNRYTILENGSFTSCLPGDDSWSIVGSQIIYDRKEQLAEIWNGRFKIGKVPIFYSPYLQMPVGDKHRSGFLVPNTKYGSHSGFEFSTPYYLNIAPNYDATITSNYMSKRGTQIQTEFRYLTTPGEGLLEFDWLFKNQVYRSKHPINGDKWLIYWRHNGVMDQVWRFNVNYTKVSYSNYFNDLDSKYGSMTDGYATQKFNLSYANENWNSGLSYKQFQVFNGNSSNGYCVAPQFDLTYYKNNIGPFNFKVFSQVAKFTNVNNDYPEAIRLHIEPMINLPLINRWGSLNTEAKMIFSHYQQKNIDYYNENTTIESHLKSSVNQVLPQFKTDGKMVFERDMDCALDYTQTLEPRLQYLYVSYRNQNNIGVYDSTILQTDYSGLFRDRAYSGFDRILSANQLVGGVTTRIYDDQDVEIFNASVGQIYYFSRPRTDDINNIWDNYENTGSVVLAGDSYWRISNQWGVRGNLQYKSYMNSIVLGNAVLEYRRDENRILQLNYRYASPKYIEQILTDIRHPSYQQGISQLEVIGSWPLLDRWSLVYAYYYNTKTNQIPNQVISLQYNTCCWAINMRYERKISGWNNTNSTSQYDNKVSFNIELRGLSNNYGLSTDKILRSGILP